MRVGERMTPHNLFNAAVREEFALTMQRYRFALDFVRDKTVLDSGCGVGNGTFLCSGLAKHVLGIDIDPAAITYATTYYPNTNLDFRVHDANKPLSERFEVIVSLDTIEHIADPEPYLEALASELMPGGRLILSTPQKSVLHLVYPEQNRFHLHEMDLPELKERLARRFEIVALYGQHSDPTGPKITEELTTARTIIAVCTTKPHGKIN